jgi:hypothetical protein
MRVRHDPRSRFVTLEFLTTMQSSSAKTQTDAYSGTVPPIVSDLLGRGPNLAQNSEWVDLRPGPGRMFPHSPRRNFTDGIDKF